jgi:pimeloyl-ACP methyl ester carboxylesterase
MTCSYIDTPFGRIAYRERGEGPVALFVHGVIVNSYLWRHPLAELSALRRCIAVDLMAHGQPKSHPTKG